MDREVGFGEQHRAGDALRLELVEAIADDGQAGRLHGRRCRAWRSGSARVISGVSPGTRTTRPEDGFRPSVASPTEKPHPGFPLDAPKCNAPGYGPAENGRPPEPTFSAPRLDVSRIAPNRRCAMPAGCDAPEACVLPWRARYLQRRLRKPPTEPAFPMPANPRLPRGVADAELANAIRALAMDAVEAAKSGHPGMPMGMAEIAVALWTAAPAAQPRAIRSGPIATASSSPTDTGRCCCTRCCT